MTASFINMRDILTDSKFREELFFRHPLFGIDHFLITPPIKEAYQVISRAIALRDSGVCFLGPSGMGKTTTLSAVARMLRTKYSWLNIYEHDTKNQQIPSIRAFFKSYLHTVNHTKLSGETFDLRLRLTNTIVDNARQSGHAVAVLFVDEAQAMSTMDFLFLKDVSNSLARSGICLVTVLTGQSPDFDGVIRNLVGEGRLDVVARFALRRFQLRGYSELKDIEEILGAIDVAVFPEGSSITWTQFFFPLAFESGFRLINESANFLNAIKREISAEGLRGYPARPIFSALRTFVIDNAGHDRSDILFPSDSWTKSVQSSLLSRSVELAKNASNGDEPSVKY
ncbi:ATP-binding protein [Noviherbaspirillum denitrificans]|uniref:AAA+ ATPase domain-containing protein n=1 Tax=Noviherbaspirillum denitrificans TaxID=1968433 RepID=A0A254TBY8_9BURK|nr:ATP-binding protein [Noviherbaspirillum denitrificans]OWW18073.1 hypothetical protein AYR66_02325 [Noviherbaspirillum denitrificans]